MRDFQLSLGGAQMKTMAEIVMMTMTTITTFIKV